jgi:hypothetical protein
LSRQNKIGFSFIEEQIYNIYISYTVHNLAGVDPGIFFFLITVSTIHFGLRLEVPFSKCITCIFTCLAKGWGGGGTTPSDSTPYQSVIILYYHLYLFTNVGCSELKSLRIKILHHISWLYILEVLQMAQSEIRSSPLQRGPR